MSKAQNSLAATGRAQKQVADRPLLILEKQLMDTLELQWHVQQVRIRSNVATTKKTRILFDGVSSELEKFIGAIRKRLDYWRTEETHIVELGPGSHRRLFAVDGIELREQFEALICGYVHYEKQTSAAIASLRLSGDLESVELLGAISKVVERCIWYLAIYLEAMALNCDGSRLPEWSAVAVL